MKYIKDKLRTKLTFSRSGVATNDHTCCGPKEYSDKLTHGVPREN